MSLGISVRNLPRRVAISSGGFFPAAADAGWLAASVESESLRRAPRFGSAKHCFMKAEHVSSCVVSLWRVSTVLRRCSLLRMRRVFFFCAQSMSLRMDADADSKASVSFSSSNFLRLLRWYWNHALHCKCVMLAAWASSRKVLAFGHWLCSYISPRSLSCSSVNLLLGACLKGECVVSTVLAPLEGVDGGDEDEDDRDPRRGIPLPFPFASVGLGVGGSSDVVWLGGEDGEL